MGLQKLHFLESSSFLPPLWNFATTSLFSHDLEEGSTRPGNLGGHLQWKTRWLAAVGCCFFGIPLVMMIRITSGDWTRRPMPLQLLKDWPLCVWRCGLTGSNFRLFFLATCNRDSAGDEEFTDQRECWLYDVLMLYSDHFLGHCFWEINWFKILNSIT